MRILVHFKPKERYDYFEGTRLRKTIKNGLDLNDVHYTDRSVDYYDIAHFISPNDENKIDTCIENKIPVVISALYCESDPSCSYLEYKNKNSQKSINLTQKSIRVLNKASIVTVPSESAKRFLEESGILAPITVVKPAVNIDRFDYARNDEKELFSRYYSEYNYRKLVVGLVSYDNIDGINALLKVASQFPDVKFYCYAKDMEKLSVFFKRKRNKNTSKNVHFKQIPTDDIYRSALLNADIFTYVGYSTVGIVTVMEAMAAKCNIVIRKQPLFEEILKDGENSRVAQYSETLTSIIKDELNDKLQPTSIKAYKECKSNSLVKFGQALKDVYENLLKNKQGELIIC